MEKIEHYGDCLREYARSRSLRDHEYNRLIEDVQEFVETKRAHDRLRPPKFNVFNALGCAHKEDAHTSLLKYFLDPYADHDQGIVFLRSFLELVQEAVHRQRKHLIITLPEDPAGWICRKEVTLPNSFGRVDILVRTNKFIAVIENKLLAGDGDGQLARYWEFLQSVPNIPNASKVVIYLTPEGRGATEWSLRNDPSLNDHLIFLSYKTDLSGMFRKIAINFQAKESAVSVTEILWQYATLIGTLT